MEEIAHWSVGEMARRLRHGDVSAAELAEAVLAQMKEKNPALNAYLTIMAEQALAAARLVDERRSKKQPMPVLAGVPFGVSDNICTRGVRTTCASRRLANFVPACDATVVAKLAGAGAVLLGKLNMDEFAMGFSGAHSSFGAVHNPRGAGRAPGGSASGAGAAVAAGCAAFAVASDADGSVRRPAALCGVVGLKPTYGRVSRSGLVASVSSMEQVGPVARCVEDAALVLTVLCGHDAADATSAERPQEDFGQRMKSGVKGLRIAWPAECLATETNAKVKQAFLRAAARFAQMGAQVEEVSMPMLESALPAHCILSCAEAASNLARFDSAHLSGRGGPYGREVKRRVLLGVFVLGAGYADALYKRAGQVRALVRQEYERTFASFDLIMTPTAPDVARPLDEEESPVQAYRGGIFTVPANMAGLPALSLPCGRDARGLPVGLQLVGRPFEEGLVLRAAWAFEREGGETPYAAGV